MIAYSAETTLETIMVLGVREERLYKLLGQPMVTWIHNINLIVVMQSSVLSNKVVDKESTIKKRHFVKGKQLEMECQELSFWGSSLK